MFGWVILIFGLVYWFFWYGPRDYPRRRYERRLDPLEHAKARLAKGEITLEEFEKVKEAIQNS
jgi:uncharacterized membrane protein